MRDVDIPVGLLPPEIQEAARAAGKRTEASSQELHHVLQGLVSEALFVRFGDDAEATISERILGDRLARDKARLDALTEERRPKLKAAV